MQPARMRIKLWGVRGSLPAPLAPAEVTQRLRYVLQKFVSGGAADASRIESFLASLAPEHSGGFGGDTSCVEVNYGSERLILDGGSGLRRLGASLMSGDLARGRGEVHFFFTHFHWDHLIGLPFFTPIFLSGNRIHFYAVQPDLEACIRSVFRRPVFPVSFEELRANIQFHKLELRKPFRHGSYTVTPYLLDHPDPCYGYRIEAGGRVYAHAVDTEGTRFSPKQLGEDVHLYRGANVCLFDAQYTLAEAVEKMNWGHSAAPIGIDLALREGIERILFAHHDPGASDEKIADAQQQTREYFEAVCEHARRSGRPVPSLEWAFSRDGQEFDV